MLNYRNRKWLLAQLKAGKTMTSLAKENNLHITTLQKWSRKLNVSFAKSRLSLRNAPRKILTGQKYGKITVGKFIQYRIHGSSRAAVYKYKCQCGYKGESLIHLIVNKLECPKCSNQAKGLKLRLHTNTMPVLMAAYRIGARNRNLIWNLTKEQFEQLTSGICTYCGKEPSNIQQAGSNHCAYAVEYVYNGIDRIDNKKGYTSKNCVSCCSVCNKAKRGASKEEFMEYIKRLVNFNKHLIT